MSKKVLMIVNPKAGKSRLKNKMSGGLFEAVCAFSEAGYLVDARMTQHRGHATELAAALSKEYDLVVCCGGDGTLNETVSGLMQCGEKMPLGYLPAGSTNDFAASLHLPQELVAAARVAVGGVPTELDVGKFNDRYFVYVASFGAFTQTSYTVSQNLKNALGHTAYMLEAVRQIPSIGHAVKMKVLADGEMLEGEYLFGSVSNSTSIGGVMKLSPEEVLLSDGKYDAVKMKVLADGEMLEGEYLFGSVSNSTSIGGVMKLSPEEVLLSDGKYELLLVRNPKTALDMQAVASALLTKNYDQEGIIYRHVSHVEFWPEGDVPWTLDGEYAPGSEHIVIDNLTKSMVLMA